MLSISNIISNKDIELQRRLSNDFRTTLSATYSVENPYY